MTREAVESGPASDPAVNVEALRRACWRMSANLQRSLGEEGRDALLTRAVRRTEVEHPLLSQMRPIGDGGISLDAIDASIGVHGAPAVAAAIESVITAVVDILDSLIGPEMSLTLLDYDGPRPSLTLSR